MSGNVFIVLFRGVGGKTQLPTARLRESLAKAGFDAVATYINSGNAVVRTTLGHDAVLETIRGVCARELGFDKAIYALTRGEWDDLIARNPFPGATATPTLLHAAVLAARPPEGAVEALRAHVAGGEQIEVVGNVAYLHTPDGFGRSQLAQKFDRGIGVANTARNWNTVRALADLGTQMARPS